MYPKQEKKPEKVPVVKPLPDKSDLLLQGSMIYLNYGFIFSKKANIWNKLSDFEHDLAGFFAAYRIEASPITTIDGASGPHMLLLTKIETVGGLINAKGINLSQQPAQRSINVTNRLVSSLGVKK